MIKVLKDKKKVEIKGHSDYDTLGKDIVCSAVSSIVITTINGIHSIDKESIKYKDNDGIEIEVLKKDKVTLSLIDNMMFLLKELSLKYPKNIKIKEGV